MSMFEPIVDLATLDVDLGFADKAGAVGTVEVATGDLNGDGYLDRIVAVGGVSYIVFGTSDGSDPGVANLDGTNGFRVDGGLAVSWLGDINGDGFSDLAIAGDGAAYVLFGAYDGFASSIDLNSLDGDNGFKLVDSAGGQAGSWNIASVGDVNDDGIDDLAVDGYVVFGRSNVIYYSLFNANVHRSGGDSADTLTGGAGRDQLFGFGGDDTLNGLAGNDKLYGGAGADHLNGGTGADQLSGGTGDDVLNGGADNDLLDGGAGADAMTGGDGNDVYLVDDTHDTTVELGAGGYDIVRASVSWTLAGNVEALQLQGSAALNGTGNADANNLAGNDGANVLSGLAGVDTINGGGGNDTIIGGTGNDLMTGGSGADTFVVRAESVYSSKAPQGRVLETDFVYDLNKAQGDRLDLSAIDANTATVADDAFHLVNAFDKHAGQMTLTYAASSNTTLLRLDVDGDGRADYQMKITGDVHLDSGGWVL